MIPNTQCERGCTPLQQAKARVELKSSGDHPYAQPKLQNMFALIVSAGMLVWQAPVAASPGISVTQRDGNVTLKTCIKSAEQGLKKLKFTNIKSKETFVEAEHKEYSVFITCYEVQAVEDVVVQSIVIAGPDSKVASQLSEKLIKAMP